MRRYFKYIGIVIMFLLFFGIFSSNIFKNCESIAAGWSVTNFSGLTAPDDQDVTSATRNVMGTVINTIKIVGTGVAIIMITYVAIKYMSAAPSEKAEFKKSAVAYIVGAIVLFAASNILSVINNFATANIK